MGKAWLDVVEHYAIALRTVPPAALAGALIFLLVTLRARQLPPLVQRIGAGVLAIAALVWVYHLRWVCDDAFISFRYAENFVRGRGLVWNVGERVEGYTNFLWTILCAGAIGLGLDPGQFVIVLGIACFVAAMWVTARLAAALSPTSSPLPIAAVLLGANYTFASFGTSGLETLPAALAVTVMLERAVARAPLGAGVAWTVAVFLHPDHVLFGGSLGLALSMDPKRRREAIRFVAPFALLYAPYFIWRWRYYGSFFPNTYYAKSGGGSYFSQGATYLWASLFHANLWALVPVAGFGLWRLRHHLAGRYALVALPLYLGYVAKIGGDYMLGRLIVAVLPLFAVFSEVGLRALSGRVLATTATTLIAFSLLPVPILEPREARWWITDERTHTQVVSFSPLTIDSGMFERGQLFRRAFAGRPGPRVADTEIGMLGYYSGLEVIDYFGLTDWQVAHQPIQERGRPGHEKRATVEYLRSRNVDLARFPLFPAPYDALTQVGMLGRADSYYHLGWYDESLITELHLADPQFHALNFVAFLDDYLNLSMPTRDRAQVRQDLALFFEPYYFAQHPDPARRARIEQYLADVTPR